MAQHPAVLVLQTAVTRRKEAQTCLEETIDLSQTTFYFVSKVHEPVIASPSELTSTDVCMASRDLKQKQAFDQTVKLHQ